MREGCTLTTEVESLVKFRTDLANIPAYRPGRPIADVIREYGVDAVVKLASNECPYPAFPEVAEAISREAAHVNRYPDNENLALRAAVADFLGVMPANLMFSAGSAYVLLAAALAVGGPGTSAVFATPSFPVYQISTRIAGSEPIPVPLDGDFRHDLEAMASAVRDDTTVVYLCNPNNPTGTHVGAAAVAEFVNAVDDEMLIVLDEAYHEFVRAADFASGVPLIERHPNVVVAHTFSKIYGLAGLRVGYAVGDPDTLAGMRRTQLPFAVSTLGQTAAIEALKHQDRVAERLQANADGLKRVVDGLAARGLQPADSQTNFVYFQTDGDDAKVVEALMEQGVIVRLADGGIRLTIGTEEENDRFFAALDSCL